MSKKTTTDINNMKQGQELLDDVVMLFTDLLSAAGATPQMIGNAASKAIANTVETKSQAKFTELGSLLRDCMEVMCAWRRDTSLVDDQGEPKRLEQSNGPTSFQQLCALTGCRHGWREVLTALLDFGAVTLDDDQCVVSRTPTFLLTRADAGGRLATDGLLKQLEGYLRVLHRNVLSVSGSDRPRFERACTVSVAAELEPVFDQVVRSRGQAFVDSIDEWLERNAKRESASGRYVELGVGAYFIHLGERARRSRQVVGQLAGTRP